MSNKTTNIYRSIFYISAAIFFSISILFLLTLENTISNHKGNFSTIAVEGTEKIKVKPDGAIVYLGINKQGKNKNELQNEIASVIEEVERILESHQIPKENIKTTFYHSNDRDDVVIPFNGKKEQRHHYISNNLEVKISELEKIDVIVNELSRLDGVSIHNVQHKIKNIDKVKEEGMEKAAANARKKAEKMAKSLGVEIKGVESINEQGNYGVGIMGATENATAMNAASEQKANAVKFYEGEQEIEVKVTVNFYIK